MEKKNVVTDGTSVSAGYPYESMLRIWF